jgi:hypothetical protein
MATNPFAGIGLESFGGDVGKAQALSHSAFEKSERARYDKQGNKKPTLISAYIASLIPGSAPPKENMEMPAKIEAPSVGVAPFPIAPQNQNTQIAPPQLPNQHPDLVQRLSESRNDWGL